jgi:hypothetical protein
MRILLSLVFVAGLTACTAVDSSGNPVAGGTGISNPDVRAATRLALDACVRSVATGQPLSGLEAQGFAPQSRGYQRGFGRFGLMMVEQTVSATMERRGGCTVEIVPGTLGELSLLRSLVAEAVASGGTGLDANLSTTGDGLSATIR